MKAADVEITTYEYSSRFYYRLSNGVNVRAVGAGKLVCLTCVKNECEHIKLVRERYHLSSER